MDGKVVGDKRVAACGVGKKYRIIVYVVGEGMPVEGVGQLRFVNLFVDDFSSVGVHSQVECHRAVASQSGGG